MAKVSVAFDDDDKRMGYLLLLLLVCRLLRGTLGTLTQALMKEFGYGLSLML